MQFLKKEIHTKAVSHDIVIKGGCSLKRPDILYESETLKHFIIVEIDENEHKSYTESCECARINNIVNDIGGKSLIIIRYNYDKVKHKGKEIDINKERRLKILSDTIKEEITKDYDKFIIKLIQLCYSDNEEEYKIKKEEDITKVVTV